MNAKRLRIRFLSRKKKENLKKKPSPAASFLQTFLSGFHFPFLLLRLGRVLLQTRRRRLRAPLEVGGPQRGADGVGEGKEDGRNGHQLQQNRHNAEAAM